MLHKQEKRIKSHHKIRKNMAGTAERPRLCVFRSNQHIYAQLVDDERHQILLAVSDVKTKGKGTKSERAKEVGAHIAKEALAKKIETVVFDRGGFKFHGRIKAVADGAREGGLKF